MGCASQAIMVSANSCKAASSPSRLFFFNRYHRDPRKKQSLNLFRIRASSEESDCNVEECAPDKELGMLLSGHIRYVNIHECSREYAQILVESGTTSTLMQVGKVSIEWLAGEKTKVVGTFPPRKQGWTGYVEKDTAGQTNIYSVEPAVYVAESAISSGTAGSSADGSEKTSAIAAGIALISVAAASLILLQVGKNPPLQMQTVEYSGPSLSYYINKFKSPEMIQASVPPETEISVSVQPESNALEVPNVQVESGFQPESSTSSSNIS